jgi:hypothetical protein
MSQEPITTYCPTCGKAFRVPPDLQGKKIACKGCQTHFVVQADKPGIPAAHQPATPAAQAPASPAQPGHGAPPPPTPPAARAAAVAATAKAPAASPSSPPVTAATSAPMPAPQVVDELAMIPFDDSPRPLTTEGSGPATQATVSKAQAIGKVKIESKGPYFVVKLVTAGKMVHVNIENALNDYAEDGWRLEQIISVGSEAYAVLSRHTPPDKPAETSATQSP